MISSSAILLLSILIPGQVSMHFKEYMAFFYDREEIWEHLPSGEPVTLLMYRDGDQVNLYRVIETTDGHFSPLSQSWNGHAIRCVHMALL